MAWTDRLLRKQFFEAIYTHWPSFSNLRLHEVILHQDGPELTLRLDLNDFPDKPPLKWIAGKFNRAQLTLNLIDIADFQMSGWSLNNIGDLSIEEDIDFLRLGFVGKTVQINCLARFISIDKLSGYCSSETSLS